jgi:glycosyltransferase involved in cell wall biosynthesis
MRIGITTFGGDGGKSGISQYIIKLLEELAGIDHGHGIEVIVYRDEQTIFIPSSADFTTLLYEGHLRNPVVNVVWHQVSLPQVCKERAYDVLFLPAGNRRLPLHVGCPTVGTVHDFSSIHVSGKYDPGRMFYIQHVLPFLIRRLSHVITISESSRKDIVEYAKVAENRVSIIPNGVDHNTFFPRDKGACAEQIAQKYGFQPPYILYISRIEHPGKNHARLIDAFSRLKAKTAIPHQLVLAGSDWTRAEEVHKAAAQSAYEKEIVFTGFVPGADLPAFYCGAELFVFPSLYEGFGLPILEAMACGVPVACSNLSSMPEVAGDAGVLFDPYAEDDMAGAMERVLLDPEFHGSLVRLGLERVRQYTWAGTARMTLAVIEQTAAGVKWP